MKEVYITFSILLLSCTAFAQQASKSVSLIGENEKAYELIIKECPSLLLQVTGNSMDEAYTLWTNLLKDMETQASNEGLDLRGVKIWINLFWEKDGSIKNIVYYPKPNSKNMNFEHLTNFLEVFADSHILPITHKGCFSHYGSASFPVFNKPSVSDEK